MMVMRRAGWRLLYVVVWLVVVVVSVTTTGTTVASTVHKKEGTFLSDDVVKAVKDTFNIDAERVQDPLEVAKHDDSMDFLSESEAVEVEKLMKAPTHSSGMESAEMTDHLPSNTTYQNGEMPRFRAKWPTHPGVVHVGAAPYANNGYAGHGYLTNDGSVAPHGISGVYAHPGAVRAGFTAPHGFHRRTYPGPGYHGGPGPHLHNGYGYHDGGVLDGHNDGDDHWHGGFYGHHHGYGHHHLWGGDDGLGFHHHHHHGVTPYDYGYMHGHGYHWHGFSHLSIGKKKKKKSHRLEKMPMPNQVAQAFEDCAGCRLVWKQVEMDVSNARFRNDVVASFQSNCDQAEQTTVFFHPCQVMKKYLFYRMLDDYMSQKFTVDEMCTRVGFCAGLAKYGEPKYCCTTCKGKKKPCGDKCIPKKKLCDKPGGCACGWAGFDDKLRPKKDCCVKCKKKQRPCGDKCIAQDKQCTQLHGCACIQDTPKPDCCSYCENPCGDICIGKDQKCDRDPGCACRI